jgi:hypothetical protein
MSRRRTLPAAAGIAAALLPAAAEAHLAASGMGPLYDGAEHFALSPEDILPVLALGLYVGLRGPVAARWTLPALGLGWLAGGALGFTAAAPSPVTLLALSAGLLLAVGVLLAANAPAPPYVAAACGVVLGPVRGCADTNGLGLSGPHLAAGFGMAVTAVVLLALAASVTLPMRRFAFVVAARVGGSWMAALGLLLAGWLWRFGEKAL